MKILVTGSCGHLGEALMRVLPEEGHEAVGLDLVPSTYTTHVGSITDRSLVRRAMVGVDAVMHTATLHKPHVATHSRQAFVDTNVTGTMTLLEAAVEAGVRAFIFTSTTSAFGRALSAGAGEPAAWITESVGPVPKNIYGVTKTAAEDLCQLVHQLHGLPVVVLRTSRFFPEEDDSRATRAAWSEPNAKANEYLYRRVDLVDVVTAHLAALDRAPALGFARYIISATTPFDRADTADLRDDAPSVVARYFPDFEALYAAAGWTMFPGLDRVYDNRAAREELGWRPEYDFARILDQMRAGQPVGGELAREVGIKRYHAQVFDDGPYPVATASTEEDR